ncbi:C-C chemokine receptor type 3-like [Echeneis naucrates]|uniref:C-C chemokine receptor type 3-like n=1 Tax=Echeneis naucrates TaxID=173247 RepID=A0A665V0K7_ECHNA|nr:C-C chemokine receptor type 3-like [Echeneis naucrates]
MNYADDDDDVGYDLLLKFLNENSSTVPSYVVSETVMMCTKQNANKFGGEIIPGFYFVNFLLSYLGNGLVLFIINKYEKLNTVTNIFLLNLVISNILFASSLPFLAVYHLDQWIFGIAMCKIVSSAYFIGYYSSILFLTLMTFDRYLAVVHVVTAAKKRKNAYARISSLIVWCISILSSVKELVLRNVWKSPVNGLVCEENGYPDYIMKRWDLVSKYQQFLFFFSIPLFMVMYCYVSITIRIMSTRMKEKCRTIKLIFVIIFIFFACWTPYNIVNLLQAIQTSRDDNSTCSDSLDKAMYLTRNIAYLYCCISPMFYTFLGKKFQSHFKRLVAKKIPGLRRHISLSSQSTRTTSQRTPYSDY